MFRILLTKCFQPYRVTVLILLWTYHFRVFQHVKAEISGLRPPPNAPIFSRAPTQGHPVLSDPSLPPLDRHLNPPVSRYRPLPGCESCTYGGPNATCVRVSGLFTRPTLPVGYNVITKIPQGACAIEVSEMRVSKNYLALRDEKGNYVVNGRWNIDRSGHYRAAGTLFSYRRHEPRRNRGESLTAQGPLTEPILLLVIYQQPNPGISYEYSIPLQNATFRHPPMGVLPAPPMEHLAPEPTNPQPSDPRRHHRRHRPHGHRTSRLDPPYNEAVFNEDLTPALSFPSGFDPPKRLSPATGQGPSKKPARGKGKKSYRWQVVEDAFTDCSVTCGKGYQTQLVVCIRVGATPKEVGFGQFHSVDDRHCRSQAKPVPDRLVCNSNVPCTPGAGSSAVSRGTKATSDNKIPSSETGMLWKPHQWGPCSASCGTGVRTRLVTCVDLSPLTSRSAPDERCDQLRKPADSEPCYAAPCNPTWLVSSWDVQCGESCGPDMIRRRRVICSDQLPRDGDSGDISKKSRSYYDDILGNFGKCDGRSRPPSEESCHSVLRSGGIDCSHMGQWMAGVWSQCSSTCGVPGWQTRSVVCLVQQQVANRDSCAGQEEPLNRQPCNPGIPCEAEVNQIDENEIPGVWFTSQWKNCSSPCGGTQDRDVICLSPDGRIVVHNCPWDERPQHRRSCNAENEDGGKKCDDVLCIDKDPHCHLVARARLCHYEHYKTRCCQSCEIMNYNKKTVS